MVLPEKARTAPPGQPTALDERATGASGTRLKVATRPAAVGATWLDLFLPGAPSQLSLEARVRVIADVVGALIQIHENTGMPRPHRRHGRLTPRHVLIGVDGSASLFTAREPFSKLLPPQPDLGYLAPELLTQLGPANQQSDVFSMGVLLWEALDNGRLFPHRRAASISRLIARRALPTPRIADEWALPLAEVAMKALSNDPEERYANATAFWLALREHLPAPDNARSALSQIAQRALKLELTTEIREAPPYLAPSPLLLGTSLPPGRGAALDARSETEASARYSLRPEPSSWDAGASRPPTRAPSENPAWSISESPSSSPQLDLAEPPERLSPVPARGSRSPSPQSPGPQAPPARPATPGAAARAGSEPPVSTLQVNLPRGLVDASLPFYVPSQPAPRPFPWGALGFAALMFFGVGAAVAFGAVTALRSAPHSPAAAPWGTATPLAPAPPVLPTHQATPAPPSPEVSSGERGGSTTETEPDPAATEQATAQDPEAQPVSREPRAKARAHRQTPAARRAPKSARAKAGATKAATEKPVEAEERPATEPAPVSGESLPFVEQPY